MVCMVWGAGAWSHPQDNLRWELIDNLVNYQPAQSGGAETELESELESELKRKLLRPKD